MSETRSADGGSTEKWDLETDLLVLGTGAGGLSAAVTAAAEGLRTLVLEKTEWLGGTTAYSAGTCWIPGNRHLPAGDAEAAADYLDRVVGDKAPRELRQTYLDRGPEMIDYVGELGVRFWHSATVVDYHPEVEGAGVGRALEPQTFDGRTLSREDFGRVRFPVPEFALFGGTLMVRRAEVTQLLKLLDGPLPGRLRGAGVALRLGVRWALDRLSYRRGTRLVMGNALVANLFHRLRERGGQVWFTATATRLIREDGRVVGAIVAHDGRELRVRTTRGVVLAGGGFAASPAWRAEHLPAPTPQYTRAGEGATGDTLTLGRQVGGALGGDGADNAFWFPSSVSRRRDGSTAVFPHIWDRAKPGIIAVGSDGRRFVDESVSYHRFVRAMYATQTVPAWLIIDARALRKYGLGMIRPGTPSAVLTRHLRSGYLHRGATLAELAASIGVDADGLSATVATSNGFAETGLDSDFGKGSHPFGRQYGDAEHGPNVNLGTIEHAPFYAIAVVPTPLGTSLGLRTDTSARVLDEAGAVIDGLYAVGNDAASVMGSEYPGAGGQVGAGMTFGYIAGRHAAAHTTTKPTTATLQESLR